MFGGCGGGLARGGVEGDGWWWWCAPAIEFGASRVLATTAKAVFVAARVGLVCLMYVCVSHLACGVQFRLVACFVHSDRQTCRYPIA